MQRFALLGLSLLGCGLGLALGVASPALAATATSNFTVQASVAAGCMISTTTLNFGAYDPVVANATTPRDANGSVTVRCTKGSVSTIGISQGANSASGSSALVPLRQMASGAERLRYDLYRTSVGTDVWGDIGTTNVKTYTATNNGNQTFTIFGRIPADQDVATGDYSDTVTATISF
jgi:spore coat protein U-like protein